MVPLGSALPAGLAHQFQRVRARMADRGAVMGGHRRNHILARQIAREVVRVPSSGDLDHRARLAPTAPARLQFRTAPYPAVPRAVRSSASA